MLMLIDGDAWREVKTYHVWRVPDLCTAADKRFLAYPPLQRTCNYLEFLGITGPQSDFFNFEDCNTLTRV